MLDVSIFERGMYVIMKEKEKWEICLLLAISFLFVRGMDHYFLPDMALGTETTINFIIFAAAYAVQKAAEAKEERIRKYAHILAGLYSVALVIGKLVNDTNKIDEFFTVHGFVWMILTWTACMFVFGAVFTFFLSGALGLEKNLSHQGLNLRCFTWKYRFFAIQAFILLTWLPCYLAFYPGTFGYDIPYQTNQISNHTIDRNHPPIHTLFWKFCLYVDSRTGLEAITFYYIVQLLLLSAAFAYLIVFLVKRNYNQWLVLLALAFVTVNPVLAVFMFAPTKDVIFAAALLMLILQLYTFVTQPELYGGFNRNTVSLVCWCLICCLFRNNAVYAFILTVPFLLLVFRKFWKRTAVLLLLPIVLFFVINGPVYDAMGIREGFSAEKLSVPTQQIALVVRDHGNELSQEEIDDISAYLPYEYLAAAYNPRFADPVKNSFNNEMYHQDSGRFHKLWFSLLFRYPKEYISAFLALNLPYWYPDASTLDSYSCREYIEVGIVGSDIYKLQRQSKLPGALKFYEKVASYEAFQNIPLVSNLFSITTPLWFLLSGMVILALKQRKREILVFIPLMMLWLTYMAGPVSNFRYIFPIFALYPFLAAVVLSPLRPVVLSKADAVVMKKKKPQAKQIPASKKKPSKSGK